MTTPGQARIHPLILWALALVFTGFPVIHGAAADLKLEATMVWGTNEPKEMYSYKEVDAALRQKLAKVFKWQNYFEMKRKAVTLPAVAGKPQKVDMSENCLLEFTHEGSSNYRVKLFSKGRLVINKVQSIAPGQTVVLAGDDKNDTAWFVVLTVPAAK